MLKIVACIPGNNFSKNFITCWTNLVYSCLQNNIQLIPNFQYSCNIYYVRNMLLGGDVTKGINQKPFQNQVDYDYTLWIDSDIIFNPDQVLKLIKHNVDIVSGLYKMSNGLHYATVKDWNTSYFKANGSFEFLTDESLGNITLKNGLFPVAYTGFGFILIKRKVFEKFRYPWFSPKWSNFKLDNGELIRDFSMEDVSFCLKASKLGYKINIDPLVIVGHEKSMIL